MKRRELLLVPPALGLMATAGPPAPTTTAEAVTAVLKRQAAQWSAGDIDGFCSAYHADALFLSPSGLTRGRQAVLERYKKKYVGKSGMGVLTLDIEDVRADAQLCAVAMRWTLRFPDVQGKPDATGLSLVCLQRGAGDWLIVYDASM